MPNAWALSSACPFDTLVGLVAQLRTAHAGGVLLFNPPEEIDYDQDTIAFIAHGTFYN